MFAGRAGSAPLGPGTAAWVLTGPGILLDFRIRFPSHTYTPPLLAVINHMPCYLNRINFKMEKPPGASGSSAPVENQQLKELYVE